jgi:hypothetical protein
MTPRKPPGQREPKRWAEHKATKPKCFNIHQQSGVRGQDDAVKTPIQISALLLISYGTGASNFCEHQFINKTGIHYFISLVWKLSEMIS